MRRNGQPASNVAQAAQGMALVVVLWTLGLLAVIAVSFAFEMRIETSSTTHFVQRAQATALAEAAIERGILDLLVPAQEAQWRRDGTPYRIPFGENELGIALIAEAGKIDLNAAAEELIHALLASVADESIAPVIADAILDWRDPDSNRRPRGAEDADYAAAGRPYGARDGSFLTVEELDQVLPMRRDIYQRLVPLVTTYSGQARVDAMTASREVLLAIPGLQASRVDEFLQVREYAAEIGQSPPTSLLEQGQTYLGQAQSRVYTVIGEGRVAGEIAVRRRAVVKLTGNPKQPYSVLAWFTSDLQTASVEGPSAAERYP
ncbi:MAG: general secretion pathway protein GspK [Gammaproteobacteria bacterium]